MKRVPLVILFTALFAGMCLFFKTCDLPIEQSKPDKIEQKKVKETLELIDKNYKTVSDSLKVKTDSLKKALEKTTKKLSVVTKNLNQSKLSLLALVQINSDSLKTNQGLKICDSLKVKIVDFVTSVDTTKSVYETNILQLQNLVALKDSQINICGFSYSQLKNQLAENIERERKLTENLNTAYKVQRRKVLQNKFLAAGILVLTGISTTLYINTKQ